MKPDIVTCWPRDIEYPFFIKRINKDRNLFDKVIIVMTEGEDETDITEKVIREIKDPLVLKPNLLELTAGGKDWRNEATNYGLQSSNSSYVLFMEQDFLVEDGFFEELFRVGQDYNTVGFVDNNRLHPACLLVKRDELNKTSKDFGAYPPEDDHFARVTKELMSFGNWKTLQDLGFNGWYHMASLTFNFRMDKVGKPLYYRNEFMIYKMLSQLI